MLSLVGLIEYYLPWPKKNIFPSAALGVSFGLTFPILALFGKSTWALTLLPVMVATILFWQILRPKRTRAGVDAGVTLLGVLYAGMMPSFLIMIRQLSGGFNKISALVICVWLCDITAYFVGRYLGRRKLAPEISPHKTVEGAAAGATASLLAGAIIAWSGFLPFGQALVLGALVGILAQIGDLVASTIKREVGIKDYSRTIPGHGGILDRFDGLFFVAPAVYIFLLLW